MSVSNGVYELALARIDALERERDEALDAAVEDRQWCEAARAARKAVVAENERLTRERDEARRIISEQAEMRETAYRSRDAAEAENERLRAALRASWPGISGESYERPISEVHAMVTAALAGGAGDTAAVSPERLVFGRPMSEATADDRIGF